MRLSGWVRLAIVFVIGFWLYGAWDLTQKGSPLLSWSTFTSADNQAQWIDWFRAHGEDFATIFARPLLILLGLALVIWVIVWVASGFASRPQDPNEPNT